MNTLSDPVQTWTDQLRDFYLPVSRDPASGFVSTSISLKGGTEYSVWVGTSIGQASTS